jgi:hypothetical protein
VFALVPLLGAGTSSVAYSRVVARWFDQRRGQAFGAALAASASVARCCRRSRST